MPGGLLFNGDESRTITWSPDSIVPLFVPSGVPGDHHVTHSLWHTWKSAGLFP